MQSGSQYLGLELKYCERCGTLGLRHQGSGDVYCESCEEKMAKVYKARPVQQTKASAEEACGAPAAGRGANECETALPPFSAGGGESRERGRWA